MAHFYGTVQGNRGEASRLGSKVSGLRATVNGWNLGAEVVIDHVDGRDRVMVFRTGGSNGAFGRRELVAEFGAEQVK